MLDMREWIALDAKKRCSSCVKLKVNLKVGRWVPVHTAAPYTSKNVPLYSLQGTVLIRDHIVREVEERRTINRHFSRVSLPTPLKGAYDPELVVY